ncbi:unnamed protein product [Rhodiola kirilowii]
MAFASSSSSPKIHHCIYFLLFFLEWDQGSVLTFAAKPAAPKLPPGNISRAEQAVGFHIYYGQSFKVIKNAVDSKSYLLIQGSSRMATRTKYCTTRIKSFVIPLANFSADTMSFPVSFFEVRVISSCNFKIHMHHCTVTWTMTLQLLGLLKSMKGITSDSIASECVLKAYKAGQIEKVNFTEPQQMAEFAAHFISNTNQPQACNFATFSPQIEDSALQKAEWIKYIGVFANLELRANQVYDQVKENYMCLTNLSAKRADSTLKPTVSWMAYDDGVWSFTSEKYKLQYVVDAGGENFDTSISKMSYNISIPEDLDEFQAILCTVEVVIDETYTADPVAYNLSSFVQNTGLEDVACLGFLTSKSLWRYDKRSQKDTLDWYDGGVSQPQVVLADMIEALFPTGNYTTTFMRNLAKEEGVVSINEDMCNREADIPLNPTIIPC